MTILRIRTLVLLAGLLPAAWAWSQDGPYRSRGPEIPRENLSAQGAIKGLAPGLIHLATEDGEQWLVKVEANPNSVFYYAEADPSWLRPGMLIEFSGQFDAKGQAQAAVSSLSVISPREDTKFGLTPETGLGAASKELFTTPNEEKKGAPKAETFAFNVVGNLLGVKGDAMVVAAGPVSVRAPVAEKATIAVNLNSLQLARVGDTVEVRGWYIKGQKGRAIATQVTVRAKEPLTAATPPSKTKPEKTEKPEKPEKPEKGDGAGKPGTPAKTENPKKPATPAKPAVDPLEELP